MACRGDARMDLRPACGCCGKSAAMRGLHGALLLQERGLSAGGWGRGDAALCGAAAPPPEPRPGERGEPSASAILACSRAATSCDAFSAARGDAARATPRRPSSTKGADAAAGSIVCEFSNARTRRSRLKSTGSAGFVLYEAKIDGAQRDAAGTGSFNGARRSSESWAALWLSPWRLGPWRFSRAPHMRLPCAASPCIRPGCPAGRRAVLHTSSRARQAHGCRRPSSFRPTP
jgi:hypothetical protein